MEQTKEALQRIWIRRYFYLIKQICHAKNINTHASFALILGAAGPQPTAPRGEGPGTAVAVRLPSAGGFNVAFTQFSFSEFSEKAAYVYCTCGSDQN